MAWKKGQVWQCPDEECGCEIKITRAPQQEPEYDEDAPPMCCCGNEMDLKLTDD